MLLIKASWLSFEEKKNNLGLSTLKFASKYYNSFKTNPLNNIFDDFSI